MVFRGVIIMTLLVVSAFFGDDASADTGLEYDVPAVYQAYEECVRIRESNGRWHAVNPSGNHFGAYQMTQALAYGATFHMLDDIQTYTGYRTKAQARNYAEMLRAMPVNKWPAWAQTSAFVQTLDGHTTERNWAGMDHWRGGRWFCGKDGR